MGNKQSSQETAQLEQAIIQGRADEVQTFLERHPGTDKKWINAAFHKAAAAGQKDLVEILLKQGADVNSIDDTGFPKGVYNNNPGYDRGVKCTALHKACVNSKAFVVKILLDHGANATAKATLISLLDQVEVTPFQAIFLGEPTTDSRTIKEREVCAKLLLGPSGNIIKQTDAAGNTFLHLAARIFLTDLCRTLITQGLQATTKNAKGRTALGEAVDGMAIFTGTAMQRHMQDLKVDMRKLALNDANWRDLLNLFIRLGCNISEVDSMGYTPLHIICWRFSYCTYRVGFSLGPEDFADKFHDSEVYKNLRSLGADPRVKDRQGLTPDQLIERKVGLSAAARDKGKG